MRLRWMWARAGGPGATWRGIGAGLPRVLTRHGITAELRPDLDAAETTALAAAARILAETEATLSL